MVHMRPDTRIGAHSRCLDGGAYAVAIRVRVGAAPSRMGPLATRELQTRFQSLVFSIKMRNAHPPQSLPPAMPDFARHSQDH